MRTLVKLICGALAAGWGGGCLPRDNPAVPPSPLFSAEELAKFMGTREERAARAPYSPPGWPLQRGDTISFDRHRELTWRQFPGYSCGGGKLVKAPFWVGDMAFGAEFKLHPGGNGVMVAGPDPDVIYIVPPPGGDERDTRSYAVYRGHFRDYLWTEKPSPEQLARCNGPPLPSHLRAHGLGVLAVPLKERNPERWNPEGTWTRERWLEGYVGGGR